MAIRQPVQVTYKAFVCIARVCGKRQVSKGAHPIYSNCGCSRRVYVSLIYRSKVQVSAHSSLYIRHAVYTGNYYLYTDTTLEVFGKIIDKQYLAKTCK